MGAPKLPFGIHSKYDPPRTKSSAKSSKAETGRTRRKGESTSSASLKDTDSLPRTKGVTVQTQRSPSATLEPSSPDDLSHPPSSKPHSNTHGNGKPDDSAHGHPTATHYESCKDFDHIPSEPPRVHLLITYRTTSAFALTCLTFAYSRI